MRPLSCRAQGRAGSPSDIPGEPVTRRRARTRLHPQMSRTRIRHITAILAAALAAITATIAAPAAQAADNYHDAIRDCNDDGVLQGRYSVHTLRQARHNLPTSLREYSDCEDVLARALAAAARPGSGGTGGGNVAPALGNPALTTGSGAIANNPGEKNALETQAKKSTNDVAPTGISVGGHTLRPGTAGLSTAAVRASPNDLPTSLIAALIALALLGVLAAWMLWRHGWPETRSAALRILRR